MTWLLSEHAFSVFVQLTTPPQDPIFTSLILWLSMPVTATCRPDPWTSRASEPATPEALHPSQRTKTWMMNLLRRMMTPCSTSHVQARRHGRPSTLLTFCQRQMWRSTAANVVSGSRSDSGAEKTVFSTSGSMPSKSESGAGFHPGTDDSARMLGMSLGTWKREWQTIFWVSAVRILNVFWCPTVSEKSTKQPNRSCGLEGNFTSSPAATPNAGCLWGI